MRRALAATALTALLVGLLCWLAWGFFFAGVLWTLFTVLLFGLVVRAINWFVPRAIG
jgi:hypothetical protein